MLSKYKFDSGLFKMFNFNSLITVILILISEVLNPYGKKFPDVSDNSNSCYNRFQKSLYTCSCEPYNEDYISNRPSYVKFAVSIFIQVFIYLTEYPHIV